MFWLWSSCAKRPGRGGNYSIFINNSSPICFIPSYAASVWWQPSIVQARRKVQHEDKGRNQHGEREGRTDLDWCSWVANIIWGEMPQRKQPRDAEFYVFWWVICSLSVTKIYIKNHQQRSLSNKWREKKIMEGKWFCSQCNFDCRIILENIVLWSYKFKKEKNRNSDFVSISTFCMLCKDPSRNLILLSIPPFLGLGANLFVM